MATVTSGAVVLLNGVDLSPYLKSVKIDANADVLDSTALSATTARTYVKGLQETTVSGEGFFKSDVNDPSTDADLLYNTLMDSPTVAGVLSVGTVGGTSGSPAVLGNVKAAKYEVNSIVGEILMTSFEVKGTKTSTGSRLYPGVWLMNTTVTASVASGTSYDNSTTSVGYILNLHNYAIDDADVSFQLQHSTNNSTWVNLGSAVNVSLNEATQVLDTSTTVNRYVRIQATSGGVQNTVGVTIKLGYTG